MTADRFAELFAAARAEGRTALLPFMTAGLPGPDRSVELFEAMAEAGADAFEVGIPYSDPLMDGPVVQEAGRRALAAGTSLDVGLGLVERIAAATGKPLLAMTYVNPVLRIGAAEFAARLAGAGASGAVIVDLPFDEAPPFREALAERGLGLVMFAAPTTDDARLRMLAAADPLFVYGVADLGVTGEREKVGDHVAGLARRIRLVTTAPLVLGVGISTPAQAATVAPLADGVIVGSALVRRVLEAESVEAAAESLRAAVGELAEAVRRNPSSDPLP